jgi:methylenetetrahydrofolate dehydrogenase (NADP+)/methenyltetrahydrofolate cyclohydrolase
MNLLDGKKIAAEVRAEAASRAADFQARRGRPIALDVVIAGEDPASKIYVRNKKRACRKTGLVSHEHVLPVETTADELHTLVRELNADDAVDGMIVQLPLPAGINPDPILSAIDPAKDVDGFHPVNLGRLVAGLPCLVACTAQGCLRMIDASGIGLAGKQAVVVGRSTIVGKPMAHLLLGRHATVTICHSRTADLAAEVARADVLVAAVGRPELIKGSWIKDGAVVIDVGMNRLEDGRLVGDVEFAAAAPRASWITPVPGGVGPMTVACLIANTVQAARTRAGLDPV